MKQWMVPFYLKAASEDELVRLMLANNIKNGATFHYTDIRKNGKHWYAWYLADATSVIRKRLNGLKANS